MKKSTLSKQAVLSALSCLLTFLLTCLFSLFPPNALAAEDSVCAEVKMEIRQGITLERQGFEAHLRINNGLDRITLQNVGIDVWFTNENGNTVSASSDPDNTDALFFIRTDDMQGIDKTDGTGTVSPSTSADIRWLIIPAPGASNGLLQGTGYRVGATLTYTLNGEQYTTEVSPDYIYVKPMPELTLDYFLPDDVYGDDPFTPDIEPPVPFSLGLRVRNDGSGTAKEFKSDSAQVKIRENIQGLLIDFLVEQSEINGKTAPPAILAEFGDILPNTSATGRWIMTCNISGKFEEFRAEFSHSDELGGELTSLIKGIHTHVLVRDVLVDLPGRDAIRDFLAKDETGYNVYESDSVDTEVSDQSAASSLSLSEGDYILTTPATAGFVYVRLPDPHNGQNFLTQVIRSDGEPVRQENAWLSKTRDENDNWQYFVNLFDANPAGSYTLFFDTEPSEQAPVLETIPDQIAAEGEQFSLTVKSSDPDGTVPALTVSSLPAGAKFTDKRDGTAAFDWLPSLGQAGTYSVTFSASDGELNTSQSTLITVTGSDSDSDGIPDYWEMKYFDDLGRDGTEDFDGDGVSDLSEYLNGTHPANPGTDTDSDGIPDDWETNYFGALNQDGTGDFDGDGISDIDEYLNGTDPLSDKSVPGDSDGDGMPDSWEMNYFGTLNREGTGDFDGDGISDINEYFNGTDPTSGEVIPADSDGDGMPDSWEMNYFGTLDQDGTGDFDGDHVSDFDEYANDTHPANPGTDRDSDGLADDWEINHFGTLDNDGTGDADGDGISDIDEYLNGTDPLSDESVPWDSDDDNMPDEWEMTYFGTLNRDGSGDFDGDGISDMSEYLNGTDPISGEIIPVDSDGDGMADDWEIKYFGTLDNNGTGDYDGDGISDMDEYLNGTNPLTDTRGDINQDGQVNLTDAIIALQIAAGIYPDTVVKKAADIDGDKKIGTEEAVYILRILSDIETEISGIISQNTVWTDFVAVTGDVKVADGVTLTIDPGTYIEFQGHYKLDVQGTLTAKGTPEQRITFTAKNKTEGWRGIRFDNDTGVMHDNPASELVCCNIHYGNATPGGRAGKIHDEKGGAVLLQNFSGLLISDCLISNNRAAYTGGGIRCYLSDPVIRNSIIANNTANIGGGVYCYFSEPVFTNNTVVNNHADIGGGLCFSGTSGPVLRNTAIWGNTSDTAGNQIALLQDESDPYFDYCSIQGGTAAFGGDGAGANYDASRYQNSISANPLFAEPSSGAGADSDALSSDWSLQAGSPCINAGDPDTLADEAGTEDFAGSPRISGDAVDIGAFEYQE